jgi:hypothetical protein
VTVTALVGGLVARAGDAAWFYWGTDSDSSPSDTTSPYAEPICGGNYGGYRHHLRPDTSFDRDFGR